MDKNIHFGYTLEEVLKLKNYILYSNYKVISNEKRKVKSISSKGKRILIRRTK